MFDRPGFVLLIHFFRGPFESDLLSIRDRLTTTFGGIIALIASFGLVLPLMFNHKYHVLNALSTPMLYGEAVLADKLMFICISFVVTILVTSLEWQSLFPSVQDVLILGPLPIPRYKVFGAKLLALFLFAVLLNIATSIFPAAMMPMIMSGKWQQPPGLIHYPALFFPCFFAGLFAFFLLIAVQAFLMNLLPARWFATSSLVLQAVLLLLSLTALPILLWIPNLHSYMRTEWAGAFKVPPLWFLGWEEEILGLATPFGKALASKAKLSLLVVVVTSLTLYAITYARNASQQLTTGAGNSDGRIHHWISKLLRRLSSDIQEFAVISFTVKTLLRSRLHKMLLCAILGLSLSLSFDSFSSLWIAHALGHGKTSARAFENAVLSTPLVISFFLLCGLRFIFLLPVDSRSNWTFRLNEAHSSEYAVNATQKAMLLLAALPVLLITFGGFSWWLGVAPALARTAFVLLMSLVLSEALLWSWNRIPFTCPYLPGRRNIIQSLILYGLSLSFFAYVATSVEMAALASPLGTGLLFVSLIGTFSFMRMHRRIASGRGLLLKFDDLPEPEVQALQLQPD